jgi:ferredoxin
MCGVSQPTPVPRPVPDKSDIVPVSPKEIVVKVVVDFDKCESNAVCMGIAPDVFEVRDDNFLYVLQEEPPEPMRATMLQCVHQCPTQAISLVD